MAFTVQLSDLKGIVQAHTGQGTLPNFGRAKQFSKQETTSSSWTPVQSSKGFSGHTTVSQIFRTVRSIFTTANQSC